MGNSTSAAAIRRQRREQLLSVFTTAAERQMVDRWVKCVAFEGKDVGDDDESMIVDGIRIGDSLLRAIGIAETFRDRLGKVVQQAGENPDLEILQLISALTGRQPSTSDQVNALTSLLLFADITRQQSVVDAIVRLELQLYSNQTEITVNPQFMERIISGHPNDIIESTSAPPFSSQQHQKLQILIDQSPYFRRLTSNLFTRIFLGSASCHAEDDRRWPNCSSRLLSAESIWFTCYFLPADCRSAADPWRLLFSTAIDGHSWNVFSERVQDAECSLIVIRDQSGQIFGGFAGQPWRIGTTFYGPPTCFLLTIKPSLQCFPSTGYNQNYMYFQQGKQKLINGLAMGGQMDYFALFIDQSLQRGHSKANPISSTFGNSPLVRGGDGERDDNGEFLVDYIEVWAVKSLERDDRLVSDRERRANLLSRADVLDFLEDSGVKVYSKDLGPDKPEL